MSFTFESLAKVIEEVLPKVQAHIEPVRLILINRGIKNLDLIKLPQLLDLSLETQRI